MWEDDTDPTESSSSSFFRSSDSPSLTESLEKQEYSTSFAEQEAVYRNGISHEFPHAYPEDDIDLDDDEDDEPFESARCRAPLLKPQTAADKGRLTVVLDMDETLIHSDFVDPADDELYQERKSTAHAFLEGVEVDKGVAVNIRPFLKEFLETMGEYFEPVVFTAANEEYASAVLDWVDPANHIRARLYRESTVDCQGMSFVKDLSLLGRDMRRVVLVDNNLISFLASPDNGMPCLDYYDNDRDVELEVILESLMKIKDMDDVRPFLRRAYGLKTKLKNHNSNFCFSDHEEEEEEVEAAAMVNGEFDECELGTADAGAFYGCFAERGVMMNDASGYSAADRAIDDYTREGCADRDAMNTAAEVM